MSIVLRAFGSHPLRGPGVGHVGATDSLLSPSVGLLQTDEPLHAAPALTPLPTSALDAGLPLDARLLTDPAFTRRVEVVRMHLAPIRSRLALSSSFAREANPDDAVRAAYQIRWSELEAKAPRRAAGHARLPQGRRRGASIPAR